MFWFNLASHFLSTLGILITIIFWVCSYKSIKYKNLVKKLIKINPTDISSTVKIVFNILSVEPDFNITYVDSKLKETGLSLDMKKSMINFAVNIYKEKFPGGVNE